MWPDTSTNHTKQVNRLQFLWVPSGASLIQLLDSGLAKELEVHKKLCFHSPHSSAVRSSQWRLSFAETRESTLFHCSVNICQGRSKRGSKKEKIKAVMSKSCPSKTIVCWILHDSSMFVKFDYYYMFVNLCNFFKKMMGQWCIIRSFVFLPTEGASPVVRNVSAKLFAAWLAMCHVAAFRLRSGSILEPICLYGMPWVFCEILTRYGKTWSWSSPCVFRSLSECR